MRPTTSTPDEQAVLECGQELYRKNNRPVVTQGKHGITVLTRTAYTPPHRRSGPFDICGAGDSASSGIVLALSLGASPADAAQLGNIVASITIQQIGVTGFATPSRL